MRKAEEDQLIELVQALPEAPVYVLSLSRPIPAFEFQNLRDVLLKLSPHAVLICLQRGMSLGTLNEEAMESAGWVRKEKRLT